MPKHQIYSLIASRASSVRYTTLSFHHFHRTANSIVSKFTSFLSNVVSSEIRKPVEYIHLLIAKSRFHCIVSRGNISKKRLISSCVRNVTSRSFTFIRSSVVGSRHAICCFLRYFSQLRIVIICAFTVFTDNPESERERRQLSKSSFDISSIL